MVDMVTQNFFLRTSERGPNCRNLGDNVDAITVFFNHTGEPADLALDPLESLNHRCLGSRLHATPYAPTGYGFQGTASRNKSRAVNAEI